MSDLDEPGKVLLNPECRDGKHRNCNGEGWDTWADDATDCPCECH
ncbi:hypothetical protein SEA_LITTLETOKYO_29 [Arthrobacter phage LittleTokyo]|nr:hypothetical protein SEA_LITTLETOKYO_29 [Arthrobacter phage LittleTokyo]